MRSLALVTSLLGVVVLSACGPGHSASSGGPQAHASHGADAPAARGPGAGIRGPAAAGTHRALAVAAAARASRRFPVPPGATRDPSAGGAPARRLRLGAFVGPVDGSLTRTRWWLVPMPHDRLVAWYAAHTPADVGSTFVRGATAPAPEGELDWVTDAVSAAYSSPVDVVDYARLGPRLTALRTDVTLAARADRTAATLVPRTVTGIDVTARAISGPHTSPITVTVTDRRRLRTVVAAFDRLRGAFAATEPQACGSPAGTARAWAVTFHWPGHTLVVDPGRPLCGVGRGLTRDGSRLPQTLEDGPGLDRALAAAVGGR